MTVNLSNFQVVAFSKHRHIPSEKFIRNSGGRGHGRAARYQAFRRVLKAGRLDKSFTVGLQFSISETNGKQPCSHDCPQGDPVEHVDDVRVPLTRVSANVNQL